MLEIEFIQNIINSIWLIYFLIIILKQVRSKIEGFIRGVFAVFQG